MKESILIVDDEEGIRTSLAGILEDEGFAVLSAADGGAGLETARRELPDLVLLDIWMPGIDGMETLRRLKESHPFLPVVMISGHGTIETAVRATKMGAYDFIEKPLSLDKIIVTVNNALAMSRLREENRSLRNLVAQDQVMVGESDSFATLREQIIQVAQSDVPVVISGESGTGKELSARILHLNSPRRANPLVELSCAGIPDELIESELFGHEKGSVAGATARKRGKVELAERGTLFLDRIETLSLRTQMLLLRFLREGTFERGGGGTPRKADVRVFAATVKDLEAEVRDGRFLEGLFTALGAVRLTIPPLRERRGDIPLLVEHFLSFYSHREGKERKQVAPEVLRRLASYDWPGNVRELKNIVERMVIMTPGGLIGEQNLPMFLRGEASAGERAAVEKVLPASPVTLGDARNAFERDFISKTLECYRWDVGRAAGLLGIERSVLFRKIKRYGITVPAEEGV